MDVVVQQGEKRATRRFALRLPVSVNYAGNASVALSVFAAGLLSSLLSIIPSGVAAAAVVAGAAGQRDGLA